MSEFLTITSNQDSEGLNEVRFGVNFPGGDGHNETLDRISNGAGGVRLWQYSVGSLREANQFLYHI